MLDDSLVLISGAQGWLGSRLAEVLAGAQPLPVLGRPSPTLRIRCLVLPGTDTTALRTLGDLVQVFQGDIRNPLDCEKFCSGAPGAVLFHTAGLIHPNRVREFYEVNTRGTIRLLEAATRARLKRAVIVSSNSPCGCNPHPDHLFDESSPYNPYLNYGRSKMLMEQAVAEFQRQGKIETVIVRPPWFYGPNQPPRQTLFFRMIREGKAPIVGSGENLRSMAYVDNLCQGMILAARTPSANGQIYWLADRRPYTMNEIIDTVERLLESEFQRPCAHRRLRLPGLASAAAYAVDKTLQSFGLYQQKIHVLSEMNKTIACSIAKARQELGYVPEVDLEEGMRRSLSWCALKGLDF